MFKIVCIGDVDRTIYSVLYIDLYLYTCTGTQCCGWVCSSPLAHLVHRGFFWLIYVNIADPSVHLRFQRLFYYDYYYYYY